MYPVEESSFGSKRHPQADFFLHSSEALKLITDSQGYFLVQNQSIARTIATVEDFQAEKDLSDQNQPGLPSNFQNILAYERNTVKFQKIDIHPTMSSLPSGLTRTDG